MVQQVPLLLSLPLALLTSLTAWRLGALSSSGAAAAGVIGGLVLWLGGWDWAAGLLVFFVSSSALSRVFPARRAAAAVHFEKGSRRDWAQAAANGGLGAALAVAHALAPGAAWPWVAFLGAMAAANADTWATELGTLGRRPPRRITDGRIVPAGTSGAVSAAGTAAALGGAALVGSLALIGELGGGWVFAAAAAGGLAGSLVDSWLGATWQAIYVCGADGQETEQHPLHRCGARTHLLRGWAWLNNDLVNFAASLSGAVCAVLLWMIIEN
jgi:uncharacterized protein (TIGR00297 family)